MSAFLDVPNEYAALLFLSDRACLPTPAGAVYSGPGVFSLDCCASVRKLMLNPGALLVVDVTCLPIELGTLYVPGGGFTFNGIDDPYRGPSVNAGADRRVDVA